LLFHRRDIGSQAVKRDQGRLRTKQFVDVCAGYKR
jgi:hypothetical protein